MPINVIFGGNAYSAVRFGKYKVIIKDIMNAAAHGWFDQSGDLLEESPEVSDVTFLFNLELDVEERHNLASEHLELVRHRLQLIQSYVQSGNYMEPQGTNYFDQNGGSSMADPDFASKLIDPRSLPALHGGAWKPFQPEQTWSKMVS